MGERRGAYGVLVRTCWAKDHLEDLGEDMRIILKRVFKKWNEDITQDKKSFLKR